MTAIDDSETRVSALPSDSSQAIPAHDAASAIRTLRDHVSSEVHALLAQSGESAGRRLAAASVSLSLLCIDVLDEPDQSSRYLELGDRHPLALQLRSALAVALGDRQLLEGADIVVEQQPPSPQRVVSATHLATTWLYGFGDAVRALSVLQHGLIGQPRPLAEPLHQLATFLAAIAGDHASLTAYDVSRATFDVSAGTAEVCAAVADLLDLRGDASAALALASSALTRSPSDNGDDVHLLRLVDLGVEAALRVSDARLSGLLERRGRLSRAAGSANEANVWMTLGELVRDHTPNSVGIQDALVALPVAVDGAAAFREVVADLGRSTLARDLAAMASARDSLATLVADASVSAAAHRVRSGQLATLLHDDPDQRMRRVREAYRVAATDETRRLLETTLWQLDVDGLARWFEQAGPPNSFRAVEIVAGRLGDVPRALRLLRQSLASTPQPTTEQLAMLAALLRRGRAVAELADVYERLAKNELEPAAAAAWWSAAGVIHLSRANMAAATAAFDAANQCAPDELTALLGRMILHQSDGQWADASLLLTQLDRVVLDEDLRTHLRRQHAEILSTKLGARGHARSLLESILQGRPDDGAARHGIAELDAEDDPAEAMELLAVAYQRAPSIELLEPLAALYERSERWQSLAELLGHALARRAPLGASRRAALGSRLGELLRDKLGRVSDAALAYEEALSHCPDDVATLAALAELYQTLGEPQRQAKILARLVELVDDPATLARISTTLGRLYIDAGELDLAFATFGTGFAAYPADRELLSAIEQLAYQYSRWTSIIDAYRVAIADGERGATGYRVGELWLLMAEILNRCVGDSIGATAAVLESLRTNGDLARCLAELEQLSPSKSEFGRAVAALEVRANTLPIESEERGEALLAAVRLIDRHRLEVADGVRLLGEVPVAMRRALEVTTLLERTYERAEDWPRLMAVLRHRLSVMPAGPSQVALAGRIAALGEERLHDGGLAAEHYLRMLESEPDHREAIDALARIYEATERWQEFIEITRRLIPLTPDRGLRALLLFRCGSVTEAKFGQEADAIRYYEAAIKTSSSCMPAVHGLRDLYRRQGDWLRVLHTLQIEVGLWDDEREQAGVYAQIARIYAEELGDHLHAAEYYDRAISVDADCIPANLALFERYFAAGDWAATVACAVRLSVKAMREGDLPARAEFHRKRGVAMRHTADAAGASQALVQALDIWPLHVGALDELLALATAAPTAFDVSTTMRELDRLYRRRNDAGSLLARIELAHARTALSEGDADLMDRHARAALALAPGDLDVVLAMVDLDVALRRWPAAISRLRGFVDGGGAARPAKARALWRLAELHAEGEIRPESAEAVLRELRLLSPRDPLVAERLAQEAVALGKLDDAAGAMDSAIELAASSDSHAEPQTLARLYYYKGRILDGQGDSRGALQHYRRAQEYAPNFPPPILLLARRAVEQGDLAGAELMLVEGAHAAIAFAGPRAAIPLQRGLAGVLLAVGDRPSAIDAYRGILAVDPNLATERMLLAEMYSLDDPQRAIVELRRVLERDLYQGPSYRLLASLYERTEQPERALRALDVMAQLGFMTPTDERTVARLTSELAARPRPAGHAPDVATLLPPPLPSPLTTLWQLAWPVLEPGLATSNLGEQVAPGQEIADRSVRALLYQLVQRWGGGVELYVADNVPGLLAMVGAPRPALVLDRQLLTESIDGLRYVMGFGLEAVRGGAGPLIGLSTRARGDLASMLRALTRPLPDDASPTLQLAFGALSEQAVQQLRALAPAVADLDLEAWFDSKLEAARYGGLLASGSLQASTQLIGRLAGEPPSDDDLPAVLGNAVGGERLTRYYLSDEFHRALAVA